MKQLRGLYAQTFFTFRTTLVFKDNIKNTGYEILDSKISIVLKRMKSIFTRQVLSQYLQQLEHNKYLGPFTCIEVDTRIRYP